MSRRRAFPVLAGLLLLAAMPASAFFPLADGERGKLDAELRFMFWATASDGALVPSGTPAQEGRIDDFLVRRARVVLRLRAKERLELQLQFGQDYSLAKIAAEETGLRFKDAYANYVVTDGFQITGGQFRVPFLRQNLESAFNQLLVDRSVVPGLRPAREGTRDAGGMVWGNLGAFQYRAAVFDGSDQEDTNPRSSLRGTARLAWNPFEKETGFGYTGTTIGAKRILQVAAQIDRQGGRHDPRDDAGFTAEPRDYRARAGEAFYEQPFKGGSALTVETAWLERRDDYEDTALATRDIEAGYLQAGWLLAPRLAGGRLQIAARHETVRTDRGGAEQEATGRTIGLTWFAMGHERKIQADFTRRREEPAEIANDEVRFSVVLVF
jgi:hypothetical protein